MKKLKKIPFYTKSINKNELSRSSRVSRFCNNHFLKDNFNRSIDKRKKFIVPKNKLKLKHFKIAKNSYHLKSILKNNKFCSEELENFGKESRTNDINNSQNYLKTFITNKQENNNSRIFLNSFYKKKKKNFFKKNVK